MRPVSFKGMLKNLMRAWGLVKMLGLETFARWQEHKASRWGAALAFYSLFTLVPFLIMVAAIASLAFGRSMVEGDIFYWLVSLMGPEGAGGFKALMLNARELNHGLSTAGLGAIFLLIGAAAVFIQLKDALNTLWGVEPRPARHVGHELSRSLKANGLAFLVVVATGLLLMGSLLLNAALQALNTYWGGALAGSLDVWQRANGFVTFLLLVGLFALLFKFLPDVRIAWRDAGIGALFSTVLFTLGKWVLEVYLSKSAFGSVYGAAGSLVVTLIWIYYSAQIVFLGAEFTQVYARRCGAGLTPIRGAVPLSEYAQIQQGIPSLEILKRQARKNAKN
jgi:membrane protein